MIVDWMEKEIHRKIQAKRRVLIVQMQEILKYVGKRLVKDKHALYVQGCKDFFYPELDQVNATGMTLRYFVLAKPYTIHEHLVPILEAERVLARTKKKTKQVVILDELLSSDFIKSSTDRCSEDARLTIWQDALASYTDTFGAMSCEIESGQFLKCSCRDPESGEKKVCVPELPYRCRRSAICFRSNLPSQSEKQKFQQAQELRTKIHRHKTRLELSMENWFASPAGQLSMESQASDLAAGYFADLAQAQARAQARGKYYQKQMKAWKTREKKKLALEKAHVKRQQTLRKKEKKLNKKLKNAQSKGDEVMMAKFTIALVKNQDEQKVSPEREKIVEIELEMDEIATSAGLILPKSTDRKEAEDADESSSDESSSSDDDSSSSDSSSSDESSSEAEAMTNRFKVLELPELPEPTPYLEATRDARDGLILVFESKSKKKILYEELQLLLLAKLKQAYREERLLKLENKIIIETLRMQAVMKNWIGIGKKKIFVQWKNYTRQEHETRLQTSKARLKHDLLKVQNQEAQDVFLKDDAKLWIKIFDEYSDQDYYQHQVSSKIQWEPPPFWDEVNQTDATQEQTTLPPLV